MPVVVMGVESSDLFCLLFCCVLEMSSWPVRLFVYDLSRGMARSMSAQFLGRQIDAIYHTGLI